MAKTSSNDPNTVTLSQQALNLARQIVAAAGWAKTPTDIYLGGKMLVETLPELSPLDWIKQEDEVRAMTPKQRAAYAERDKKWASEEKTFAISDKEKDAFKRAFEHVIAEGKLGPNQWLTELVKAFGLVKEE